MHHRSVPPVLSITKRTAKRSILRGRRWVFHTKNSGRVLQQNREDVHSTLFCNWNGSIRWHSSPVNYLRGPIRLLVREYLTRGCLGECDYYTSKIFSVHDTDRFQGFILIHAICLAAEHSPVKSHNLGIYLAGSACFVTASSIPRLTYPSTRNDGHEDIIALLQFVGAVVSTSLGIASGMLPRRPDVLCHEHHVDRQWTVSLLNRLTWSWVQPLLRHASLHNDIDAADIPHAGSELRSQDLENEWDRLGQKPSLSLSLFTAYRGRLLILWAVTLVRCVISILPFWFMLLILNILEDETTPSNLVELFVFVMCMASSNLLDSVSVIQLHTPSRARLLTVS